MGLGRWLSGIFPNDKNPDDNWIYGLKEGDHVRITNVAGDSRKTSTAVIDRIVLEGDIVGYSITEIYAGGRIFNDRGYCVFPGGYSILESEQKKN